MAYNDFIDTCLLINCGFVADRIWLLINPAISLESMNLASLSSLLRVARCSSLVSPVSPNTWFGVSSSLWPRYPWKDEPCLSLWKCTLLLPSSPDSSCYFIWRRSGPKAGLGIVFGWSPPNYLYSTFFCSSISYFRESCERRNYDKLLMLNAYMNIFI